MHKRKGRLFVLCTLLALLCLTVIAAGAGNTGTTVYETTMTLSGYATGATLGGTDLVPVSDSEFYVTMPSNNIAVTENDWKNGPYFRASAGAVLKNGVAVTGVTIQKYSATGYYVRLGFSLSAGDSLRFEGLFFRDENGNGRFDGQETGLEIAGTTITYDGTCYRQEKAAVPVLPYPSFAMLRGAAVRLNISGGLRFAAVLSAEDYRLLTDQNATFGMAFVRRADLPGDTLSAEDLFGSKSIFSATDASGKEMHLVSCTPVPTTDGYTFCGALRGIAPEDFYTEYVGIAYASTDNGYVLARFADDDIENNTRSCYYAAQLADEAGDHADTVRDAYLTPAAARTTTLTVRTVRLGQGRIETTEERTVTVGDHLTLEAPAVDGYTLLGDSRVTVTVYPNRENVVTFVYTDYPARDFVLSAFSLPMLDATDNFDNDYNRAIVSAIRAAGLNTFILSGPALTTFATADDVTRVRNIADLFWEYGIMTVVDFKKDYYALSEYPDFSDTPGIVGIFHYDEPTYEQITTVLSDYVRQFNDRYGASPEKVFMANLYPYEAERYGALGTDADGNAVTYAQYLRHYCETVISRVYGTRYLSVDTYPIRRDGALESDFLVSLGLLRHYADLYDCFANVCLQSSGFNEGYDTKERLPTEAELRLQAYAALAFGMDSISWFTYGSVASIGQSLSNTPVDFATGARGEGYDNLAAVNAELAAFAGIYATYRWQGMMILQADGGTQKEAVRKLLASEFSSDILSLSDTPLGSLSADGTVLVGVFQNEKSGDRAFVFLNYSAPGESKTVTIRLTAPATAALSVYRGGSVSAMSGGACTLTLAPGEGCFMTLSGGSSIQSLSQETAARHPVAPLPGRKEYDAEVGNEA